ncbi:MAG TPA: hypothetical protein VIQ31_03265 [Phormidium sp.]
MPLKTTTWTIRQMKRVVTEGVFIDTPMLRLKIKAKTPDEILGLVFRLECVDSFSDAGGGGEDYTGHLELDGENYRVICHRRYDMGMGSRWRVTEQPKESTR